MSAQLTVALELDQRMQTLSYILHTGSLLDLLLLAVLQLSLESTHFIRLAMSERRELSRLLYLVSILGVLLLQFLETLAQSGILSQLLLPFYSY